MGDTFSTSRLLPLILAQAVCKQLDIPLKKVDFVKEYWKEVFESVLESFSIGLTPNPDTLCNRKIKFNVFLDYAYRVLGADYVATGHYARLETVTDKISGHQRTRLLRASDPKKDQSFFLSTVPIGSLDRVLFPVGHLSKPDVRQLAREHDLVSAHRRESMGICFVGKRKLPDFLGEYIDPLPGEFVSVDTQEVIGKHSGIIHFTIGQGARMGGFPKKLFVCGKDVERRRIYVTDDWHHPTMYSNYFYAKKIRWLNSPFSRKGGSGSPEGCYPIHVMLRNTGELIPADITILKKSIDYGSEDADGDGMTGHAHTVDHDTGPWRYKISLREPIRALAPGQTFAVFSEDTWECLGGGDMARRGRYGDALAHERELGYL